MDLLELVLMVDTESDDDNERVRFCEIVSFRLDISLARSRPRPNSFFANCSSATPFFLSRSCGTSLANFGMSFGFASI